MENQNVYLEHANISFKNVDRGIEFFQTAFPHFVIRGKGEYLGRRWFHVGDDVTYVAVNEASQEGSGKNYLKGGINHIGFVVDDVDAVVQRLEEAGFKRDYPREEEQFRIRDYYADDEGNQYEFIQYLSDKPEERNLY